MRVTSLQDEIATEIRVALVRGQLNQSELAARLGHSQPWVSYRLNGKVAMTVEDLYRIARALNVPVTELLPRVDSNHQPAGYWISAGWALAA